MLSIGIVQIVEFYASKKAINSIENKKSAIVRESEVALSIADVSRIYETLIYEKLKEILVEKGVDAKDISYHTDDLGIDGVGYSDFMLYGESLWNKKQLDNILNDNSGFESI